MNRSAGRSALVGVVALLLSAVAASPLFAQAPPPLGVTATAGTPSPNPAPVGPQPIQATLNATALNVPIASYPCSLQPPMWSWSTQNPPPPLVPVIQYSETANGPWVASPGGCSVYVSQPVPDPTQPDSCVATLGVLCTQPGHWRISPVVTVAYSDGCGDNWSASTQVTVADITAVSVTFAPSSVTIQAPGQTAPITATVAPADAASLLTFDTYDHTVATVTGSSSMSPVPLTVLGVGNGATNLVAWLVGSTYCMAMPVAVGAAPAVVSVPLGPNGIKATGPGAFKTYVPTAAGGILNITVTGGTRGTILYPDGATTFPNNTDTSLIKTVPNQYGWYTFNVGGAPTNVTATFTQTGQTKTRPWNFYYWTTQGPYIREFTSEGNLQKDTSKLATSDDVDQIPTVAIGGAVVAGQMIITAGPNGTLETTAAKGDQARPLPSMGYYNLFTPIGAANGTPPYTPLAHYDARNSTPALPLNSRGQAAAFSNSLDALTPPGQNGDWQGHCTGGSVASIMLNVPKPGPGAPYGTDCEELKGLWVALAKNANHTIGTDSIGYPPKPSIPPGPPTPGMDKTDVFAPQVHNFLEQNLRKNQTAFVCDLRGTTSAVDASQQWNYAAYKYSATYEQSGADPTVVKITTTLTTNSDVKPPTTGVDDHVVTYVYIFPYDATGSAWPPPVPPAPLADWVSVSGAAAYAPGWLYTIVKPSWANPNYKDLNETNVRKDDAANP